MSIQNNAPNIERLLAAFKHQKSDRVPNFEIWIGQRNISHILEHPDYPQNFWTMPPKEAVELVKRIGQDAMVCSFDPPLPGQASIFSLADLEPYTKIKLDTEAMRAKLKACVDAVKGTGIGVALRIGGPFTQTYMACGPVAIESFMLLIYDDPELLEASMRLYTGWILQIFEALKDIPFHFYYIGDDLCDNSGLMVSPSAVEQFWVPYYKLIMDAAHATGRPILCHCCGKQAPVIPYWLQWGVEACHPLQSRANDIYEFKKKYGGKLCPVGNIDVGLLATGTPAQIREDVRAHINALAGDGGYVLCSDHSIVDSVIPENFLAMIAAGREFGQY